MSNIIPFERPVPHGEGKAFCMGCNHTWHAVVPVGETQFECPECRALKGRLVFEYMPPGKTVWSCPCENQLFYILPDGSIFCPNCGVNQTFPKGT